MLWYEGTDESVLPYALFHTVILKDILFGHKREGNHGSLHPTCVVGGWRQSEQQVPELRRGIDYSAASRELQTWPDGVPQRCSVPCI